LNKKRKQKPSKQHVQGKHIIIHGVASAYRELIGAKKKEKK